MKAAIYNPYLDTLGGGERYTMAVAQVLLKSGHDVHIEWKDKSIQKKLEERFGIKLQGVSFVDDIKRGSNYDLCFWVSDGSIPLLSARTNFIHFQIPFKFHERGNLITRMKLLRIKKIICNSYFTKKFIDKSFGINSVVLYPPADIKSFKPKKKLNQIIYVGRFSKLTQSKRQDVLIESFKKVYDQGHREYKLILAGGIEVGTGDFIYQLEKTLEGYPIKIIKSPSFKEIMKLVGESKIFWSAAGYGVDEDKHPSKVEHFGISVVEAMSAKCVPVIYKAGGYKEIIENSKNGFLWNDTAEFINKTINLIEDKRELAEVATKASLDSQKYSYENFEKNLLTFI